MEIGTLSAAQNYAAQRPATRPSDGEGASVFGRVAMDFAQTLAHGEQVAKDAMVGKADPHSLVQALAQTELAVETAVTVRNKVVEAYQEILRMPV
ncbi:flagellar hook-basal body complex protein FliE [Tateyamaria omphalii]|uniref:Flagellar hook-basal body protein FliE n=1 Tax=Tateyamaria omphalii TaxID=299262 RepID=A0A1P8MZ74_9RHOB|nr:flagellar hook-basal body complex protein FliE [Tateyamaria omphalii]APX13282.1 flagellar hook-basal body protein FliE [Tateyamaria omphalii]